MPLLVEGLAVVLAGSLGHSVWRVWLWPHVGPGGRGELHHPTAPLESERPSWLVTPETGPYTGVLVVGP